VAGCFAPRTGALVTVEGLWGAGKTTTAGQLGRRLAAHGFDVEVVHYRSPPGVVGRLSRWLEEEPLRARTGTGGFRQPHHATVDVFLRLCREAWQHTYFYRPALKGHDVVVVDHGVYSKLAYCLTVLGEQHPDVAAGALLGQLKGCVGPWFLVPDRAYFLDVPWPLARERAILRGRGGGVPGSIERLLFLPRFDAAYRRVVAAFPDVVVPVVVDLRGPDDVAEEIEHDLLALLRVPTVGRNSDV
jgi:dTMP kinase